MLQCLGAVRCAEQGPEPWAAVGQLHTKSARCCGTRAVSKCCKLCIEMPSYPTRPHLCHRRAVGPGSGLPLLFQRPVAAEMGLSSVSFLPLYQHHVQRWGVGCCHARVRSQGSGAGHVVAHQQVALGWRMVHGGLAEHDVPHILQQQPRIVVVLRQGSAVRECRQSCRHEVNGCMLHRACALLACRCIQLLA